MFIKYLLRLKIQHLRALREQKGQSLIIFVFAILGLIAMMGLALDLGLVYIERIRVSRTTDAATLAAVVELPFEEEAIRRAVEYIELNGYTQQDTEIRVRGCIVNGGNLANVGEEPGQPGDSVDSFGVVFGGNNMVRVQPSGPRVTSGYVYRPALADPPKAIFVIDTLAFQAVERDELTNDVETENQDTCDGAGDNPSSLFGTANKLRVSGQVMVDMNFMQFFGFSEVPVSDEAVAENVTNLDVVVVFDISGSMDYETNCFGCWNEDPALSADIMNNPFPTNGFPNPLDFENADIFWGGDPGSFGTDFSVAGDALCSATPAPATAGGFNYLVHEAEFYSQIHPVEGWKFEDRQAGQGFWVIQRQNRGSNGTYIRPHPFVTYSQSSIDNSPRLQGASYNIECWSEGECWKSRRAALGLDEFSANQNPPYVEYDFTIPPTWGGNTHIWIRAIGGNNHSFEWNGDVPTTQPPDRRKAIYWQVDGGDVRGGEFANLRDMGSERDIASDTYWRWVKIAGFNPTLALAPGQHKLRLYQGSSGFHLDKIIITDNDDGDVGTAFNNNGSKVGSGIIDDDIDDVLDNNGGEGPDATPGSATREACNMCNPAFGETVTSLDCTCRETYDDRTANPFPDLFGAPDAGAATSCFSTAVLTPTNNAANDLFHDVDPLRSAQEAVKNFAARLDPKFDQIGVVAFTNDVPDPGRMKLNCLRWEQNNGGALGQKGCFDPTANHPDSTTGDPISYTRVIQLIEDQDPDRTTNIAEGVKEGLEELGVEVPPYVTNVQHTCSEIVDDRESCDRQGAARRVLVVMTDGAPNRHIACPTDYHWRGKVGASTRPYDCAMFFAKEAAQRNVVVYTIGIGPAVDRSLLKAMAEGQDPDPVTGDDGVYFNGKGGRYFPAAKPSDLDAIFEQILENIYVRIVG